MTGFYETPAIRPLSETELSLVAGGGHHQVGAESDSSGEKDGSAPVTPSRAGSVLAD
jgi:hypothetical protein